MEPSTRDPIRTADSQVDEFPAAEPVPTKDSFFARLHRSLGPLAGGMILDFVDLLTFGPIALFGGFLLGGVVGWWISGIYRFRLPGRILFTLLAMVYTFIPFTEPLPLATIISAVARFFERPTATDVTTNSPQSESQHVADQPRP